MYTGSSQGVQSVWWEGVVAELEVLLTPHLQSQSIHRDAGAQLALSFLLSAGRQPGQGCHQHSRWDFPHELKLL